MQAFKTLYPINNTFLVLMQYINFLSLVTHCPIFVCSLFHIFP